MTDQQKHDKMSLIREELDKALEFRIKWTRRIIIGIMLWLIAMIICYAPEMLGVVP